MRNYILFCVVCLQLGLTYGEPAGVGVYAYQDSAGNSVSERRSFDSFAPLPPVPPLKPLPSLFPAPSLVRPIRSFAPFPPLPPLPPLIPFRFWPPLPMRFRPLRFDNFGGFGGYNSFMSRPNSAFAGGAIGPGFTHQIAAINPENPNMQNVNVLDRFADTGAESPRDGYYSVSSSSYASSSNVDGKQLESRGAETVVNKNGQITRYKVQN